MISHREGRSRERFVAAERSSARGSDLRPDSVREVDIAACNPAVLLARSVAHGLLVSRGMMQLDSRVPPGSTFDRPRERLWKRGVQAVGDEELISILLGTGVRAHPALAVATDLVRAAGGVAPLSRASPQELSLITGVGAARAARVAAAFELGRRAIEAEQRRELLGQAEDVFRIVAPRVAGLQQELFFAIGIDVRNGLIDVVEVARGSVHSVEVHPREVFRPLVRMAAAGVVVAHNHPSGDPTPSFEDVELTRRLKAAGDLLGIPLVDHVVIGENAFRSVREWLGTEL